MVWHLSEHKRRLHTWNAQTWKGFWFAATTFLESFLINYGILFYIWSWKQIKAELKCEMLKEPALNFLWK